MYIRAEEMYNCYQNESRRPRTPYFWGRGYPFGKRIEGLSVNTGDPQARYKYNGKEIDEENGLNWLAYGARYYDPEVCRWHVVDPAEQYSSKYLYCFNNPIKIKDVDGNIGFSFDWDIDFGYLSWSGGVIFEFGDFNKFQIGYYRASGELPLMLGMIPPGGSFGVSIGFSYSITSSTLLDWSGKSYTSDLNYGIYDTRFALSEDGKISTSSFSMGVGAGLQLLTTQNASLTGVDFGVLYENILNPLYYLQDYRSKNKFPSSIIESENKEKTSTSFSDIWNSISSMLGY